MCSHVSCQYFVYDLKPQPPNERVVRSSRIGYIRDCPPRKGELAGKSVKTAIRPNTGTDVNRAIPSAFFARAAFSYEPIVDVREGLKRLLAWYREDP